MGCPSQAILTKNLVFTVTTVDADGLPADADSAPTYRLYEDETATPILTGTMALLDAANTDGFYSEQIAITAGNGFESYKSYTIRITVAVGGDTYAREYSFNVAPASAELGPGDRAVTITIRTTGESPLAGVSVWLNTSNDRSGAVAGSLSTDDAGQVEFNLNDTTYYVFCHKAGYNFLDGCSITVSAGATTFTKDIGIAATTGSDSDYTESFLTLAIDNVREAVDEPELNAKYSDANIIGKLERAYARVLGEINRNSRIPLVVRHAITFASGTTAYALPYHLGTIWSVYTLDSDDGTKLFYHSMSRKNPLGQFVWVEGNELRIQAGVLMANGTVLTVEALPSGCAHLHNGTCTVDSSGLTVTFGATPHAGSLDTHPHAYMGSLVRILKVTGTGATGNVMQERYISAYNSTTRVATLDVAFDPVPVAGVSGNIFYEIAPAVHRGLDQVIALHAARHMASQEGDYKRASGIKGELREQMREVRLRAAHSIHCTRFSADTVLNNRYMRI